MVCDSRDDKSSRPNTHKNNRRHLSGQSRGYHRDHSQVNGYNDTTFTPDHHHGGILRAILLLECALEPPTTRAKIHSRANLAHSVTAINSSPKLSGATYFSFRRCSCSIANLSSNAAQIASAKSPRAPTPSADDSYGVVPAAETSASSVVSSSQVIFIFSFFFPPARTRASSDVPLSHGLCSATVPAPFPSAAA